MLAAVNRAQKWSLPSSLFARARQQDVLSYLSLPAMIAERLPQTIARGADCFETQRAFMFIIGELLLARIDQRTLVQNAFGLIPQESILPNRTNCIPIFSWFTVSMLHMLTSSKHYLKYGCSFTSRILCVRLDIAPVNLLVGFGIQIASWCCHVPCLLIQ